MQVSNRMFLCENVTKLLTYLKLPSSNVNVTKPQRTRFSSQKSITLSSRNRSSFQCFSNKNVTPKRKLYDVHWRRSLNVHSRYIHILAREYLDKPRCLEKVGSGCTARKHTSSLFVSNFVSQNTAPVEVDLQLEKRVARCEELKRQLKVRGISFDVDTFVEDFKLLKRLEKEKNRLERERESVAKQMAELKSKKATDDIVQTKEQLITRGKQIKEALKELQMTWWLWEEKVTLAALTLPNSLRSQTPDEKPKILEEFGEIPDMSEAECHVEFVRKNNLVKFSSIGPKAYYLKGSLATLEQTLINEITTSLDQSNFHPMTTPEIFRSLVAEGCGVDYKSENEIFSLHNKEEVASRLDDFHLVQGVSFMSFAAYLTKTVVQTSDLPYRLHTTGRQYTPSTENDLPGLFGVSQTVKTAVVSVTKDRVSCLQEVYKLAAISWVMYRRLKLASRFIMRVRKAFSNLFMAAIIVFLWRTLEFWSLTGKKVHKGGWTELELPDQTPRKMPSFQHGYRLSDSSPEPRFRYGELQFLVDKSTTIYVGYYDDREEEAFVKIPALFNMRKPVFNFTCTVHYPDHSSSKVDAELRRFVYKWRSNKPPRQWRPGYVMCPVSRERQTPSHVLLSIEGINNETTNVTIKAPTKENNTLTRCIRHFNNNYDNVTQLVWNIEFLRILGVNKQIFYLSNQTERVLDVLRTYEKEGWVELRDFHLPKRLVKYRELEVQLVAIQDCVLSEMHTSKYVVAVDVDEIIFPRVHKDIVEMADFLFKEGDPTGQSVGSLRFHLAYYPTHTNITDVSFPNKDIAEKYNIDPLLHMMRYITRPSAGPKSIVKPKSVDVMFVHFAESFVNDDHELFIDDDIGALFHYRRGTKKYLKPPLYRRTEALRFSKVLSEAVEERYRVLEKK